MTPNNITQLRSDCTATHTVQLHILYSYTYSIATHTV